MQTKAIILIFAFAAIVAVLAEEESNKKDENVGIALQVSSEKPEYSNDSRLFNPRTTLRFFFTFKRELDKLIGRAYKRLQSREKTIKQKEQKIEKLLKNKFNILKRDLGNQQAREGFLMLLLGEKDKIKECMFKWLDFNVNMRNDYLSALQCIKNSTEESKKILKKSREELSKTNRSSSTEVEHWVKLVKSCFVRKNGYCIQLGITVLRKSINKIRDLTTSHTEIFDTVDEKLWDRMDKCRVNFERKLKKGKGEYIPKMRACFQVSDSKTRRRLRKEKGRR